MKKFFLILMMIGACLTTVQAQRGGRSGGGGGGARPGGFHAGGGGGGGVRMAQPNMGAGMARPMPQQRPQTSMPQMNRPQGNMGGINRPSPGMSRPNMPTVPSTRPGNIPQANRPTGGMTPGGGIRNPNTPSTLPSSRPSFPTNRPNLPATGNRPATTLPGVTRPNVPDLSRPGGVQTGGGIRNPNAPSTRPGTLPANRPGAGVDTGMDRPTTLPGTRPGTRPGIDNRPGGGGIQPGNKTRPGGDSGGISPGKTRPGGDAGGIRPGDKADNRPNRPTRPNTDRPVINNPNINIGNQINNNVINHRPNWVNINNTMINNINNNWNNAITNRQQMHNWITNNPNRYRHWNQWGDGVRNNWRHFHNHNNWFGGDWWSRYHPAWCGWHYRYWLPYYPYNYWWSVPTWVGITNWFNWSTPTWQQPVYYDYGTGGNVTYQNNNVYVGGQQVASSSDFAQTAAALATVDPPKDEEQAAQVEWMPLGTFALSTGEKDTQPTRVVQLAVTKDGIIGGTLFNYQTDQTASIQGRVDKETQRVAFRIGENDNLVAETGMYNLTKDEVPVLVHFGTGKTENFLFIRLNNEDQGANPPK